MSTKFSYAGLRCILEYLEANKRIHIASRSLILSNAEKSIPIHLDILLLEESYIEINKIGYRISKTTGEYDKTQFPERPDKETLTNGDVRIGLNFTKFLQLEVEIDEEVRLARRIPKGIKGHVASKYLMCYFLERRGEIYVGNLHFIMGGQGIFRLPAGFKVHSKRLHTQEDDFRNFLGFLNESSFPLKELTTMRLEQGFLNHELVNSAEKVTIDTGYGTVGPDWFIPELIQFRHKNMGINTGFADWRFILMRIIRRWQENGCEVGTEFRMVCLWRGEAVRHIESIRKSIGMEEIWNIIEGEVPAKWCLFKPINSILGVYVYKLNREDGDDVCDIVMRVMEIKKAIVARERGLWEILRTSVFFLF